MLMSMTGYGRAEGPFGESRLQVEIRSVNHRFGEISVRLPRTLGGLEAKVRESVNRGISRGKINVSVTIDGNENTSGSTLRLNRDVAKAYLDAFEVLKVDFQIFGELAAEGLLALPDVMSWEQAASDDESAWESLHPVLEAAVRDVQEMKQREGRNLERDLRDRLSAIETALAGVQARVPEMIEGARMRLRDRLEEISQNADYNRDRLEVEMTLFVDRSDCTEECVRLRSHIEQFRQLIDAPEPAGRKLNFLLQEMNREVNTIGSKSQDVPIARDVIQIKEECEKLREQVQNFE